MKEKRSVGRPRLADKKLKKSALLYLVTSIILVIVIATLFAINNTSLLSIKGSASKFIFYNQNDTKWQKKAGKGFCGRTDESYNKNACGPTSVAMVIANLTNEKSFDPVDATKEAKKYYYCGKTKSGKKFYGMKYEYLKKAAKLHNLKYENVPKNSTGASKIKKALKQGGYAIAYVDKDSPFTSGWHYIVIYKLGSNGKVYIADPEKTAPRKEAYNLSDFYNKGWLNTHGWSTFIPNKKTTTSKKTNTKPASKPTSQSSTNEDPGVNLSVVKGKPEGKCPVAPVVEGVLNSDKTYNIGKVKISVNTSTLTAQELKNIYVVEKPYNANNTVSYKIKGKSKKEKIGVFKDGTTKQIATSFKKSKNGYYKTINTGDYYYFALYSGGKKCYYSYFVKQGYTIKNYIRKYKFSKYNVVTKKGVVRGIIANAKASSSNNKVLAINKDIDSFSYKSTGQNVYVGKEANNKKQTTITITNSNNVGKFNISLPSRYYVTGYLLNPLTNSNKSIGKVGSLAKASHTKNSDGKKVYGTEIKTSANKKVYAMDSGTVIKIRNSKSKKDTYGKLIQIRSSIRDNEYVHTYANLSNISVKKGDRVYKGQTIGKTSKSYLFVSFTQRSKDKTKKQTYNSVLLNNFVGRKIFYAKVDNTTYKTFQKWIDDAKLCLYQYDESICNGKIETTTTKKPSSKPTSKKTQSTKPKFTGGYTKILLVGNSYTYYNGLGQIVSKLANKTGKKAIVVRATRGSTGATGLATAKLEYIAWSSTNGTISSGNGKTLKQIIDIDFGKLKRAGKWDYVVLQNNDGTGSLINGDRKIYNIVKNRIPKSKNFILNATPYSSSVATNRYNLHLKFAKQVKASVIRTGQLFGKYEKAFGRSWVKDLTLCDSDKHPSGRGAYLDALTIYAKIYGVSDYAKSENSTKFIELYNKNGGSTHEFASNWFRKSRKNSKPSSVSYSVDKKTAKKLQALVRRNYKSSVLAY